MFWVSGDRVLGVGDIADDQAGQGIGVEAGEGVDVDHGESKGATVATSSASRYAAINACSISTGRSMKTKWLMW